MQLVSDTAGNNATDAVGNIADGVENCRRHRQPISSSLAPERSYEISCTSLMKGIFLIRGFIILMY